MLNLKDYRNKEIRVLCLAVFVAIVCVTTIAFTIDAFKRQLYHVSAAVIGGDRLLTANMPFETKVYESLQQLDLKFTESINFYSMLATESELMLASVKAVGDYYPLLGDIKTSIELNEAGQITNAIPAPGEIWLESRAILQLNAHIDQTLNVAEAKLKLTKVLTAEPDRLADGFTFAPRALINIQDVAKTKAIVPGSRVTYRLQIIGDVARLQAFDTQLQAINHGQYEVKSVNSNLSSFNNLEIAQKYLSLALLINLFLAAVTVAISAKQYSASRRIDAAVLRCFGATKGQLLFIYFRSLTLTALVIGTLGTATGFGLETVIARVLLQAFNLELPTPGIWPLYVGIGCALVLLVGIGLPAMFGLLQTPPFQLLKRQDADEKYSAWRLNLKLSNRIPALLRLSINNIFYNSQHNLIQVLAFCFVICAGLILFVVRNDLLNSWQAQIPQSAPNYFALNIPEAEIKNFQQYLFNNQINADNFYPTFRGILTMINSEEVSMEDEADKRTGINRPLNLTWSENLPYENQILQGRWFTAHDHGKPYISIERDIAQRLNVKLGDKLTFNITNEEVTAEITSIRSVIWGSFTPNFYVIYNPGFIKDQPLTYMGSFFLAKQQEHILLDMVKQFPQINLINVTAMLDQAKVVISLLSLVIVFIWTFTFTVSVLLLIAVMLATLQQRIYQNNLMRILGATKKQIQNMLLIEYSILGSIAGLFGATIALLAGKQVAEQYFAIIYHWNWIVILLGVLFGILVMTLGAILALRKPLLSAPLQITRE